MDSSGHNSPRDTDENSAKDSKVKKKRDRIYVRIQKEYQLTKYKLNEAMFNTQKKIEEAYYETIERMAKIKLRVWKIFLVLTILFYVLGIGFAAFGTYSPAYKIQKVSFTTEISYNRAIENQDLLFNNVSILPDNLEIFTVSAYLLTPTHPPEEKLPGIVWSHGMVVNAEGNLHNAMDLAAAGFKVLATNLPGHGDTGGLWDFGLNGLQVIWSAVEYMATLDDVNPTKIAVMGHSNGGLVATRAGIFDKTPLGTGGKIKAVGSIWGYTDLNDTLSSVLGTDVIDDEEWGVYMSSFIGCSDGVISQEDVARRSIGGFINSTNIPNYYLMTGDTDGLTTVDIQFALFDQATGGYFNSSYLKTEYSINPSVNVENLENPHFSFINGTARKLTILPGQDHVEEVVTSANMDMMIGWMVRSLALHPEDHVPRSCTAKLTIEFCYISRIFGGYFILVGTFMLILMMGYLSSHRLFPKAADTIPQYIPLLNLEKNLKLKDYKKHGLMSHEQEFRIDYVGNPRKFVNSWKKKTMYVLLIIGCFVAGISVSWLIDQFFLRFWIINIYIWQYFWTAVFLFLAVIIMFILQKKGDPRTRKIKLKKIGLTPTGFCKALLFLLLVIGVPLLSYNLLAIIFRYPKIIPRPFSKRLYLEVFVFFLMTFFFYFNLEMISKTQLFEQQNIYPSFKGYLQEIVINGSIIWLMWLLSYLIGGIFINSHLKWLLLQGNTGSAALIVIGIIMIGFQGFMAYTSAFFYQQTRNIFAITLIQAAAVTLLMTGKYIFIYSII